MRKISSNFGTALLILLLLTTPVFAFDQTMPLASDYIAGTYSNISAGSNGNLTISFRVTSPGSMTKLGATSIEIYENNGRTTKLVDTVYATDAGYENMMGTGTSHASNITYDGTVGYQYYAKVHLTASNSNGGETTTSISPTVTAKR